MASPAVDEATGISLTFPDSAFTAQLLNCDFAGYVREFIETTHQGTVTWKTFKPKRHIDAGGLEAVFHHNPSTFPPITEDAEALVITFPNGTTKITVQAFMTNYRNTGTLGDKMVANATIKFSGEPVVTEV